MRARDYTIRPARPEELPTLIDIETESDEGFREVGFGFVTEFEPISVLVLESQHSQHLVWVVVDSRDLPVGFALVKIVDDGFHLLQMAVVPAHGRRGLGKRLAQAVIAAAGERGYHKVTLTTFENIPWNEPFYAKLGFRRMQANELGVELTAIVAGERSMGVAARPRVSMQLDL